MNEAKPFVIDKRLVWEAYHKVKENKGSAGIDKVDQKTFDKEMSKNLYKIWNRMSSGCYFPKAVKLVKDDSYGYRPGKGAHQAIAKAKERCYVNPWVLDMDISKFFDTINHDLLMKAVRKHTEEKWVLLYIERWLKVPYQTSKGEVIERTMGVPQGSVIGPVLANLFLHYVFDEWMSRNYPTIPFERYADDTICHCVSEEQAQFLRSVLVKRFEECGLKLNEESLLEG